MLNDYIWNLYLEAGGNEVVSFFENNLQYEITNEYPEKIEEFHKIYCPDSSVSEIQIKNEIIDAILDYTNGIDLIVNKRLNKIDSILNALIKEIKKYTETEKEALIVFNNSIAYFSTMLSFQYPELFFPYYFQYNFNFLRMISDEFGINLPNIPKRNDYIGRIKYYGEICKALHEFQVKNHLTTFEVLAFLYDFAPNYLGGYESYIEEIKDSKGAYFVGAGYDDLHFQYNPEALKDPEAITFWQCSPDTRVGDAVVMYFTSPDSSIDYIWKSISKGFNDPFFNYYRMVYLSHPTKVKSIKLQQLKSDETLSKMSIVRKNMQGVNGTEIFPTDYNYLLDLMNSDLKRIDFGKVKLRKNYKSEDDFVKKFVIPLVEELGYSKDEYKEQIYIQAGNYNTPLKLIPDITLMPKFEDNSYTAFGVIEAKYSIKNQKELEEAQNQVRSYSRQLLSKYAVVISMEKIWVMSEKDKYKSVIFEEYLENLKNPDIFRKLMLLIGKPEFNQ